MNILEKEYISSQSGVFEKRERDSLCQSTIALAYGFDGVSAFTGNTVHCPKLTVLGCPSITQLSK